ncbi:MAG TPA: glycogen debranching protein [Chloroflexota bacterium]|nr:glycogen debranching protein [Chloroflexota bacterium]
MSLDEIDRSRLWDEAVSVLHENDLGAWTRPAPRLYPHQWSWDSAFIATGLAHLDPARALTELRSLLRGQWTDGRIPHIVYNAQVPPEAYFPDSARWNCSICSPCAPADPSTSGIIQPPVHALALARILDLAGEQESIRREVSELASAILQWHRYLATHRDPDGRGLITIYHPWESGTDNSPRWDAPIARVQVGQVRPYVRRDLAHVADPSQRPSNQEYDCYVWLIQSLERTNYDDEAAHASHPFLIKDALFSAIFAAANRVLAEVYEKLSLGADAALELRGLATRFSQGVLSTCSTSGGSSSLALDVDLRAGAPVPVVTWAGLAPLLLPEIDREMLDRVLARLESDDFMGNPDLAFPVVPSTAPGSLGFRESTYWRGPAWPIANYLLWWALDQHGLGVTAERLRTANLQMLSQPGAECPEYFQPFSGKALGSRRQSWTAAAVVDWLALEGPKEPDR